MIGDKASAGKAVENRCKQIMSRVGYKKVLGDINDIVDRKHKIPIGISNDYISLKKSPIDAPEEILYCIMEAIDTVTSKGTDKLVSKYFEENEIKSFKKYTYKPNKIKFPISFEAIQIDDSQWIGKITVQQIMNLSPLIIYNENTQRNLKREALGETEIYSIFLNRKALNEITKSYQDGSYIPNTITLNIPEDVDFTYEDGRLTFKKIESLDILDGYHRYVAMVNLYSTDNNFDYPMEIRWVNFNEDKARQFIWQEDQKTKMTKLESNAFNQNNPSNQLINMLNQVTTLKNIVDRNGNVDSGVASGFISILWFDKNKHTYSRKEIVEVKKEIEKGLTEVINLKPEAFDSKWNRREIGALFLMIYHKDVKNLFDYIEYINKKEIPVFYNVTKREMNRLEEAYQEFK